MKGVEEQIAEINRTKAWGVYAECCGTIDDMHASIEVRDSRGELAGFGDAAYGWDGEKPCGWVRDPWGAAAEAVRMALARLRQSPLFA